MSEEQAALDACFIFTYEGYWVKSITSNYKHAKHPKFKEYCEFTHPAGFDLILIDDKWKLTGVEVKKILTMDTYKSALGQAITYFNEKEYKEVIIFARKFQNEVMFNKISDNYFKTIDRLNIPL